MHKKNVRIHRGRFSGSFTLTLPFFKMIFDYQMFKAAYFFGKTTQKQKKCKDTLPLYKMNIMLDQGV